MSNDTMRAALLAIMRAADAAKEPCGMDPESPAAIRNGKFATIALMAAQGLGMVSGPDLAAPAPQPKYIVPPALYDAAAAEGIDMGACERFAGPVLQPDDRQRCIDARNYLNAALHGEGAVIDTLEQAVLNACAAIASLRSASRTGPVDIRQVAEWSEEVGCVTGPAGEGDEACVAHVGLRLLTDWVNAKFVAPSAGHSEKRL